MSVCPECNSPMKSWGSRQVSVLAISSDGMPVRNKVIKKRWRCSACKSVRSQPVHERKGMVPPALRDTVADACFHEGFAAAGRMYNLDEKTARTLWNEWAAIREADITVPSVLGMHTVSITGSEYTLLTDMKNLTVIELLEDTDESVRNWLKGREHYISEVIIGFVPSHRNLLMQCLPDARIMILPAHTEAVLFRVWDNVFSKLKSENPAIPGFNASEDRTLFSVRRRNMPETGREIMDGWRDAFLDAYENRENLTETLEAGKDISFFTLAGTPACILLRTWGTEIRNGYGRNTEEYQELLCTLIQGIAERRPRVGKSLIRGLILLRPERSRLIDEAASEEGMEEEYISSEEGVLINDAILSLNTHIDNHTQ